jgi:YD repeat-containing protein
MRFDEKGRPLIADPSSVSTFSRDLQKTVNHVSTGSNVRAFAYNGTERLLAIATLDGDILQFEGGKELATLSSGFEKTSAFAFDPTGNLWVVNDTACPVHDLQISIFSPGQVRPSRLLHISADANSTGIVIDGDGTAAVLAKSCYARSYYSVLRIDSTGNLIAQYKELAALSFSNR